MSTQNATVLITGATSGIGLELAKLFAKDKFNMVIVSRDEKKLHETAEKLKELGANEIAVISKDLSVVNSAVEVYEDIRQRGIKINILVNDAGVGEYGPFSETSLEKELALIQLNVISLVQLTKLFVRDMLKQGGGRILQLASVASYQPTPLLAVYSASKAFILSFSDSLGTELRDKNITVTALIPAATNTDFFHKAGMENTKAAKNDPDDPAVVAKIGYTALRRGEPHAYAPKARRMAFMSSISSGRTTARQAEKEMQPVS